jgi:hypothetical protein
MLFFFIGLSLALFVLNIVWYSKYKNARREIKGWILGWIDKDTEYEALEQGTVEIEENYQQELLDQFDKVGSLTMQRDMALQDLKHLLPVVIFHSEKCLPTLESPMTDEVCEIIAFHGITSG